jgi:hypothetical protein
MSELLNSTSSSQAVKKLFPKKSDKEERKVSNSSQPTHELKVRSQILNTSCWRIFFICRIAGKLLLLLAFAFLSFELEWKIVFAWA